MKRKLKMSDPDRTTEMDSFLPFHFFCGVAD
jgi:hypothetical protein